MIKQLHASIPPTHSQLKRKNNCSLTAKQMMQQLAKETLQPRKAAIDSLLAKAALIR
jgi:hypothetical protein